MMFYHITVYYMILRHAYAIARRAMHAMTMRGELLEKACSTLYEATFCWFVCIRQ